MADIVLKNREGQDVSYEGVNVLRVYTPEGNTKLYHNGEIVTATIEPDFSEGNMVVDAGEGKFYSEVTIKKPENLRPEVILKDENVAGIVGTLEPSSGGGDGGGGGAVDVPPSDINFFDYDGTIVAAWTLAELAAATELPENPTHSGLISQGWNWTLANLKANNSPMNVGQMYITDDGKTRLYIRIAAEGRMTVPLQFSQTVDNGVTIDWGDGSATETLSGTDNVSVTHTYADIGEYVITLLPSDGCSLGLGGASAQGVFGGTDNYVKIYKSCVYKVEIGEGVTSIGDYAFWSCFCLETITLPIDVATIGTCAFMLCQNLRSVTVPANVTTIHDNTFRNTSIHCTIYPHGLRSIGKTVHMGITLMNSITIPPSVESIGFQAFSNNAAVRRLTISDGVQSIGEQAFSSCGTSCSIITVPASVTSIAATAFGHAYGVKEFHFKRTTPPALANTNGFSGIPTDCIIYVPKGCLSAYQSATNWSTYASQMQEETE